jgi:hypothetical protein
MKLTINGEVYKNTKKKDGTPFIGKNGKPYTLLSFGVKEEVLGKVGARVSGFMNRENENWKDGDEIEVEVTQNGEYLNFKMPDKNVTRAEFDLLINRVKVLEDRVLPDTQEDVPIYEEEG